MKGKPQNRIQEVSADEIKRLIQAVALYCGISPTGSKTTGASPQNSWSAGESQWEGICRVGLGSLHGHPAGRLLAKKVISDDLSISTPYTTTTSYLAA